MVYCPRRTSEDFENENEGWMTVAVVRCGIRHNRVVPGNVTICAYHALAFAFLQQDLLLHMCEWPWRTAVCDFRETHRFWGKRSSYRWNVGMLNFERHGHRAPGSLQKDGPGLGLAVYLGGRVDCWNVGDLRKSILPAHPQGIRR